MILNGQIIDYQSYKWKMLGYTGNPSKKQRKCIKQLAIFSWQFDSGQLALSVCYLGPDC